MAGGNPNPKMKRLGENLAAASGQFSTPRPTPKPLVKTRGTGAATKALNHRKSD